MTERKVLIVRVKGGIGDAVAMTRYILNGLSCGVLVLPDEVSSYSVEELPMPTEAGSWDEKYIGRPPAEESAPSLPALEVVPLVQEESGLRDGSEAQSDPAPYPTEPATPFKPKGAMAEIKREVFIRLQAYQQRTKLGWAQRVSDATGGKVAPDVVRLGLLEARDIGVDRWKLIGKALDKLEEEMEK